MPATARRPAVATPSENGLTILVKVERKAIEILRAAAQVITRGVPTGPL
jgi:hypothetical protein